MRVWACRHFGVLVGVGLISCAPHPSSRPEVQIPRHTVILDPAMAVIPNQTTRPAIESPAVIPPASAQVDLTLPIAALCTRVDGYGVYDSIDPVRFSAGKEHPVIVYCEVENFASQINGRKQWETRLSSDMILYTEAGTAVWSDKSKSIIDQSRNRRHDFFIVKKTKLPATLGIGRYLLKISVVDQQSHHMAETTLPVQIAAE